MRQTTLESEVLVILDGKPKKGTVSEVFSPGAARIQFGDGSTVQASYSSTGEEGTFHYPDETKAVKESDTFGDAPGVAAGVTPADSSAASAPEKPSKAKK